MADKNTGNAAERELRELLNRHTRVVPEGVSVDISAEEDAWRDTVLAIGEKRAYRLMAEHLAHKYKVLQGHEFLFSDRCMAYELGYHVRAYLWARGEKGFFCPPSARVLSREKIISHCRTIELDVNDVKDIRQRLLFRYRFGVRSCWRGTTQDPFRRLLPRRKK